jgi:septal ring factor EnvC (AmiA/AmiB activator)
MKMLNIIWLALLLALFGCGNGADTTTPVAELEQEAETLSVEDLKAKASAYQDMIAEKMQSLEPITEKLKEIPLTEQMGDEAKALQADIKDLQDELGDLKERLQVYLDALKEKGESVQEYMN